jgi:hypothetical protein
VTPVFFDNFTGTNDDPWDSNLWSVSAATATVDIQGNRGRMALDSNYGIAEATALMEASGPDWLMTFTVELATAGQSEQWHEIHYLFGDGNGYRLTLDGFDDLVTANRVDDGSTTEITSQGSMNLRTVGEWNVEIENVADGATRRHNITVWDASGSKPGSPTLTFTDASHTTGGLFLRSTGGPTAVTLYYDDIEIFASDPPAPPDSPTGFAATALSSTHNRLTWNAVDGATGYVIQRRIKLS